MGNSLVIFEGHELEVLTKEDVNIAFDGEVLFNGKQTAEILGYTNPAKAIRDHVEEESKLLLKFSNITNRSFRKLHNTGETFLTEDGTFDLIYHSKLPSAKKFRKKVKEIVFKIQKTGKFDSTENSIMQIEDEKERNLKLKLYKLGDVLKTTPDDMLTAINYNNTKQELNLYIQSKELQKVAANVDEINNKISRATVLREGDMSAKAIATKFNIFSPSSKPHTLFADNIARDLGFYINPTGNAGYQDNFVSVNLTTVAGKTVPIVNYSKEAVENMENLINENGLNFVEYELYKRGSKKGTFKNVKIRFESGQQINVNETTYNIYTKSQLN